MDVDILVRDTNILDFLESVDGFKMVDGKLSYGSVPIDILTPIDNTIHYEQIQEHIESVEGIQMLKLDFALAVKVKCAYLRAEDENGMRKQESDFKDAVFHARQLQKAGLEILTRVRKCSKFATTMSSVLD